MTVLAWALSVILVLLCSVIVFLILGQDVRGGGLAGALGGGSVQSAFGSRTTETVLKFTAYLMAAIFVLVIVLIRLHSSESDSLTAGPATSTSAPYQGPAETPAAPATPTTPATPPTTP